MNIFQQTLWNDLISLTELEESSFYYKDHFHEVSREWFRIFNYRLTSYNDWSINTNTLNCRGTMFHISHEGKDAKPIQLISLPLMKFFNLNENPMVMDLDISKSLEVTNKLDGSLISTYLFKGKLYLKTKGSLISSQAVSAMELLDSHEYISLKELLYNLTESDHTINLEYTAPSNRIVLSYEKPALRILNIRNNNTGQNYGLYNASNLPLKMELLSVLAQYYVDVNLINDIDLNTISTNINMEGYVFTLSDRLMVKVKTDWYIIRHNAIDSIGTDKGLALSILNESIDDIKSMLSDDTIFLSRVAEMEYNIIEKYTELNTTIVTFYENNKHLERKEYAILGQKELKKYEFGLVMMLYTGREFDLKEFMIKNITLFI